MKEALFRKTGIRAAPKKGQWFLSSTGIAIQAQHDYIQPNNLIILEPMKKADEEVKVKPRFSKQYNI